MQEKNLHLNGYCVFYGLSILEDILEDDTFKSFV